MSRLPALFVSHGAPTLAVDDSPAHRFLKGLGEHLGKPNAVLMLSAHFEAPTATVTASASPGIVYDFYGFPDALYDIRYPAAGDPALARRAKALLEDGGIPTLEDDTRGLDHGAWVPLSLMYPDADVPVVQLSINAHKGTQYHLRLGELLRPFRDEGILIVGSGGATHNLSVALRASPDDAVPEWVITFREWLADAIANDRRDELVNFRSAAPDAARNHPTDEHFLPLLSALGATERGEPRYRVHESETYGSLAMDMYVLGGS